MTRGHPVGTTTVEGTFVVPRPRQPGRTRDRLIEAAVALTVEDGWSGVTMARLADRAGVSRQTVYNEIGAKAELAEAIVLREVDRALGCLTEAFESSRDAVTGFRNAAGAMLRLAREDGLLPAVVAAAHGIDDQLVPGLVDHSRGLVDSAQEIVRDHLRRAGITMRGRQPALAVEVVVRALLSQVMHPPADPDRAAADLAGVLATLLRAG